MSFTATICPACQRDIQIPSDIPNAVCPYCGASIGTDRASPAATVATLMGMAQSAELAGNNAEALTYFNRVLEAEPRNSDAWIGKGKAAAWQTTLANIRIGEMLVAFNHAISTCDLSQKDATIQRAAFEANHLIVTIYQMARNHMLEFVAVPTSWPSYVGQMGQMLDALETVHSWNPVDKVTLENIVFICKDNIEGVSYRDSFNNNAPAAWTLTPQYEATIKSKMDNAASKLKALDPSYSAPTIAKKKADDCFVVTATMGDAGHPDVMYLRAFRDNWLRQRTWGDRLARTYYRYGPRAAAVIGRSDLRRAFSRLLIVKPGIWLATLLWRDN